MKYPTINVEKLFDVVRSIFPGEEAVMAKKNRTS